MGGGGEGGGGGLGGGGGGGGKRKRQGKFSRVGFRWMMRAFKQPHFSIFYIIY